jgi:hypothetical protein
VIRNGDSGSNVIGGRRGPSLFAALETLGRVVCVRIYSVALMAVCFDLFTRQKTVVVVDDFG